MVLGMGFRAWQLDALMDSLPGKTKTNVHEWIKVQRADGQAFASAQDAVSRALSALDNGKAN